MNNLVTNILDQLTGFASSLAVSFTFWFWVAFAAFIIGGIVAMNKENVRLLARLVNLGVWLMVILSVALLAHFFDWYIFLTGSALPGVFPWGAMIALFFILLCCLFGQIYLNNSDDPKAEMEHIDQISRQTAG